MQKQRFLASRRLCLLAVLGSWLFLFLWSAGYFRALLAAGRLLPVSAAQDQLPRLLAQTAFVTLPEWLLLAAAFLLMRPELTALLCRPGQKPWARRLTLGLWAAYVLSLGVQLFRHSDRTAVLFRWFYYLLAVALLEEFLFRAWMPLLLSRAFSGRVAWVLPNALFALSHSMLPLAQGAPPLQILAAACSGFLGYLTVGLGLEALKRRSGSLLPGVLLHALADFGFLFG